MEKLFFELIQVAVGTADRLSHTPTEEEWQYLYQQAKRQTLLGVLYDALSRLPETQYPPKKVLVNFHSASEKIRFNNQRLNRETVWTAKFWKKQGYRNVILKGQGNALLYPDASLRTPGDVDVWLDGDRDRIAGYIKHYFPKLEVTRIEMDFPARKGTTIEVHFQACFLYNPLRNHRMQHYFHEQLQHPKVVQLPDGEVSVPNDEMNLVFQLTHIYRHLFYEGIGLRQLMDYFYLIHNSQCIMHNEAGAEKNHNSQCTVHDEAGAEKNHNAQCTMHNYRSNIYDNALKQIERLGLKKFCRALMWVEGEVFGMPREWMLMEPDEKEGRFLLKEIMLAGNFGHADDRVGDWSKMNRWERLTWGTKWSWRLIGHYPGEVLWHPFYRISQYVWRLWKGYL